MSYAVSGMSAEISNAAPRPEPLITVDALTAGFTGQRQRHLVLRHDRIGVARQEHDRRPRPAGTPSAGSGGQSFGATPGVASRAA
jgi:hypothetical protein